MKRFFTKYATFSGRASRSEYWWWFLVSTLVGIVLNIIFRSGVRYTAYGSTAGPGTMIGGILAVMIPLVFTLLGPDPRGQQCDNPRLSRQEKPSGSGGTAVTCRRLSAPYGQRTGSSIPSAE